MQGRKLIERLTLIATLIVASGGGLRAGGEPHAQWERLSFDDGVELHTLFSVASMDPPESEAEKIPIISVLRDTLGDDDPDNDRLRFVWLLAEQDQGRLTKWMAHEPAFGDMPRPLVDLAAPGKGAWKAVLRRTVQAALLDPRGAGVRIPSRSYGFSRRASRTVRLHEALSVTLRPQDAPSSGSLAPRERTQVLARMLLAESALGGLTPDAKLEHILEQRLGARRQALGRNWELLRQRAEAENLIFQPIGMDGQPPIGAMLWVSRADLDQGPGRQYRSKFLGIADPWNDSDLLEWSGYTETWCFDSDGRRTSEESAAAGCEELIPLALYSLDHPKAPFLLIDFRSNWKPAFRETARRTLEEVPRTVFGLTLFANFELGAIQLASDFVRGRRGAPVRRRDRLRAVAAVRQGLPAFPGQAPELRERLTERLGAAPSSTGRYESLLAWARSPDGLPRRIEKDRGRELARVLHPTKARWLKAFTIASAGLYRYREPLSPERLALLDSERRLATAADVVEAACAAGPRVDVGADFDSVRRSAYKLASVESVNPSMRKRAERLLRALAEQPLADEVRRELTEWTDTADTAPSHDEILDAGGLD